MKVIDCSVGEQGNLHELQLCEMQKKEIKVSLKYNMNKAGPMFPTLKNK